MDTTSATTSCPGTWGSDENAAIGLSMSPVLKSPRTSLASEPQIPERMGLVITQSGRTSRGVVHVVQAEGQAGEHRFQFVGGGGPDFLRSRRGPKEQRFHGPPSGGALSVMALIPIMKLSKSVVFISITAFMSGR